MCRHNLLHIQCIVHVNQSFRSDKSWYQIFSFWLLSWNICIRFSTNFKTAIPVLWILLSIVFLLWIASKIHCLQFSQAVQINKEVVAMVSNWLLRKNNAHVFQQIIKVQYLSFSLFSTFVFLFSNNSIIHCLRQSFALLSVLC